MNIKTATNLVNSIKVANLSNLAISPPATVNQGGQEKSKLEL